jgi:pSer/pThr/pTyr-binding forkhead associated (FHA) protein
MNGFTKCENGHYYKEELSSCPYCHGGRRQADVPDEKRETQLYTASCEENKTRIVIDKKQQQSNRTVFGTDVVLQKDGGEVVERQYRDARKLVGWLVTYSFDPMGADFRIYEGRNTVGRDVDCNITVPDHMISGKHALIHFFNGKFKIKDELSSHGTYVNDSYIEDELVEIHDGDLIKMGETVLKFKIAI